MNQEIKSRKSPLFEEYERMKEQRREEDKKSIQLGLLVAIILHIGLFYMIFPDFGLRIFEKPQRKMIRLRNYRPPQPKEKIPPPPPKKQVEKKKRKIKPIPDPTPDEPEVEPEPELEPEPIYDNIPDDIDIVFGEPEPPPALGPLVITGDIKPPQPIKSTMIQPKYTDTAKLLRIQGSVIVNFVVTKDGFPTDIYVAQGLGEKTGLDQAAIEAIKKWVFKPALQNGKPVSVYYSWKLNFTLQ